MEENLPPELPQEQLPADPAPKPKRNWLLCSLIALTSLIVVAALVSLVLDSSGKKTARIYTTLPAETE